MNSVFKSALFQCTDDGNVSTTCGGQGDRRGRFRCGSRDFDSVYDGHDGTCRVGLWNQSGDYVITD